MVGPQQGDPLSELLFCLGIHQGDPLSELLFCLGIHLFLQSTSSPNITGLFDDITLGGPKALVATDIDLIQSNGSEIGLILKLARLR